MTGQLSVLIVDDSQDDAALIARALSLETGAPLRWSRVDTESAMREQLRTGSWDVVLADFTMPRFSAASALAVLQEEGSAAPCILVSGTIVEADAIELMRAGACDFVEKGHLALLPHAVERALIDAEERRRRTAAEAEVAAAGSRLRTLLDHSFDVVGLYLPDGRPQLWFGPTSLDPRSMVGDPGSEVRSVFQRVVEEGGVSAPIEITVGGGAIVPQRWEVRWANEIQDPVVGGIVLNAHDVTERHRAEEELRERSLHDPLTGLPNRVLMGDRLASQLARLGRAPGAVSVLMLDLDDFKVVNDTLGHTAGDDLLISVAGRLTSVLRPADTLARFGGDEFVVVAEVDSGADARRLARRLAAAVAEPFHIQGHAIAVTLSIGIALTATPDLASEDLVREADAAMYAAKTEGRGRIEAFDPAISAAAEAVLVASAELRRAIASSELRVHFQPIVKLGPDRGLNVGAEALVRWCHPERGLLMPSSFIPLAEEVGLIDLLGDWVLREACLGADLATSDFFDAGTTLSVNVAPSQLYGSTLISTLEEVRTRVPDLSLCVEITETVVLQQERRSLEALRSVRALGVSIALDDFGTGYASLRHLRRFPIDRVKIDRSFVAGVAADRDDLAVVTAVIDLAHALGMDTVAEGVETLEQVKVLEDLGCDFAQGYHFMRPVPLSDLHPVPGAVVGPRLSTSSYSSGSV